MLQTDVAVIYGMFEFFFEPKVLFIIVDMQPDFKDNDMKMQQQWELGSSRGISLLWDYNRRSFEWKVGKKNGGDVLYKQIEGAIENIDKILIQNGVRNFEIRPVLALKK